jgi:hypothetical protein
MPEPVGVETPEPFHLQPNGRVVRDLDRSSAIANDARVELISCFSEGVSECLLHQGFIWLRSHASHDEVSPQAARTSEA